MSVRKTSLKIFTQKIGPNFVPTIRIEDPLIGVLEYQLTTPEIFSDERAEEVMKFSQMILEGMGLQLAQDLREKP